MKIHLKCQMNFPRLQKCVQLSSHTQYSKFHSKYSFNLKFNEVKLDYGILGVMLSLRTAIFDPKQVNVFGYLS